MISTKAKVTDTRKLAEGIFGLTLSTKAAIEAKSGQFIMVNTKSEAHLLGRPISICDIDKENESLSIVWRNVGYGTKELSTLKEGEEVDIIGPLGNGFPTDEELIKGKSITLLGGGIGAPPLYALAKELSSKGVKPVVILGYRSESAGLFLKDEFERTADVIIATDDGSAGVKGTVIDALKEHDVKSDIIMACGPMPMLKGIKNYAQEKGIDAYISLEERMACGVGACLGCVVKTTHKDHHSQVNNARICTEGPVFEAKEVEI